MSDYLYSQYNQYPFGTVTRPQFNPNNNGYHQGRNEGVPNTTPQVVGFPSTQDMELAEKIANGEIDLSAFSTNPVTTPAAYSTKGAAWEGYSTPEYNGTGDLIPVHEGRKDEIIGLCYSA